MNELSSNIVTKLQKLAQVAQGLRKGESFSVTRFTSLKSLCEDPDTANRFVLHLAKLTCRKMKSSNKRLRQYKTAATKAISLMESYLKKRTASKISSLREFMWGIEQKQNQYKKVSWQMVRIVTSQELLLVEYAMRCFLSHGESSFWGYQTARVYAERYSSRYGDGLIPKSTPMVEDIADFWCRHYLGKSLKQCLSSWEREVKKMTRTSSKKAVNIPKQGPFEAAYPNLAEWVNGYGWIELGHDDCQPSFIRVLDIGGMVWDSGKKKYKTVDQALADAEAVIIKWRKENRG
jgi:hypothetical protein